jgi:regulator of sirC expression with transglutaminase-like and TPR domain
MPEKNFTKELTALIQLLDEPDEKVYTAIRSRILAMGTDTLPLLEEAEDNIPTPKETTRIREIIHTIRVEDVFGNLKNWATNRSHDLLEAWLLISRFHSPKDNTEQLKESVNKIYRDIWVEMNSELTALEKIRVINHVFYNVYQFDALQEKKPALASYLLGNVLRMQKGNPLSMALLYLIIVQRLHIPVFGVNLPKHIILAYMNGNTLPKPITGYQQEDVLFYLNPFNKGAVFRKSEIELFIRQLKVKEQESFFLPCENKVIIRRLLQELSLLHKKNHNIIMAGALHRLQVALDE